MRAVRAISLLGVFALAKIVGLIGYSIPLSGWSPFAYFWQDALAVLIFAALDSAVRWRWLGWGLYAVAVAYAALNVPLIRVLSSPLTWPMLRATRGTLSDSIKHHATMENLTLMLLVIAAGIGLPYLLRNLKLKRWGLAATAALSLALLGPLASSRMETIGLHRNAALALVATSWPRIASKAASDDWRSSPFDQEVSDDLSHLRGAAMGRNVVMIALESTGAQYLRPYGAPANPMPHLTELARQAILFEHAYAVYPESIKALFSVLCAQYPAMDTEAESYAELTTPSIAALLADTGYRTALFHSGRFMYLGMEAIIRNRGYQTLEDAGAISGEHESSFGVDEASTIRRIFSWLDALKRDERFFLTYLPIAGHHPYDTPKAGPFPDRNDADRYLNALHYADASLGQLMRGLRERGLDQNTLFVIFGDHGEAFGQHEGNYGHSLFLYEENLRVPYLIIAPGLISEQMRVARAASLIDTAPTILDLLGLKAPPAYQGKSLLEGGEQMALFYTDYSLSLLGLRDGCWKYIHELESGRSKLFDLCRDAEERNDLARLHPERIAAYRAHLQRWGAAQKAQIVQTVDSALKR
jgi:phosphoglycerol transferase MdoB-like AlkP superfamily enzyme